ncbi:ABC transporter substrate-binding protein [Pseudomonas typographi]|uniref:ABC transporter substrate-binding protein n=1 Tax=Pseudomonas typographi TaxID=2715964 RepID=A0ABR7YX21_9PSED|nr:ABC transporter substrate-binding protein [Pseudomonas typographi]MBD1551253.1 ABC transporter substrate-binding protein [Pseudomonas typographi]MBD1586253.1 ABC transporter substrate-binding protein [Pseudomonas typographi]MBD1597725.1 ABC transporter substrate-binding protein [Pseudomonas typographi]
MPTLNTPAFHSFKGFTRTALAVAAPLALVLALGACKGSNEPAGNTLKVAFWSDNTQLVSIDPFQVYWLEHRVVLRNVAESLTDQDPQSGKIIPWLAERWAISPDAREYTFYLRQGVTFSDGTAFDAQAVKTAFDADKAFAQQLPSAFGATYLAGYDHAEVLDPHTVKLVLAKPNAGFLQATSTTNLAILAPASYALPAQERSRGKIIGTGPFVVEHYTPEKDLKLVKRQGYAWPSANVSNPGEAHVDSVEFSYIPEDSVRNGLFLQGKVDILWPRNPFAAVDLKLLEANKATLQSRSLPGPAWNLYPNTRGGRILADIDVRHALLKAIDRTSYAHTVYNPTFPVVKGVYDDTTPYFRDQSDKLGYDPDGAAQLLDHAGWAKGEDGYRYKAGQRLTLVYNVATKETAGDVLIQDQLRQVGIDLKLKVQTKAEWAAANASGNYDLTSTYMTRADPIVLQTILDPRTANSSTLATNTYTAEVLPRAQVLFDAGLGATDDAQRSVAYGQLQDLLVDQGSAIPVYERLWQAATSPRVKHFKWTAEGFALLSDIEVGP